MMSRNKIPHTEFGQLSWLYRIVFKSQKSIVLILFLMLSFLVQPFHQAFANEALFDEEEDVTLPDEVAEQLPDAKEVQTETAPESESNVTSLTSEEIADAGSAQIVINDQPDTEAVVNTDNTVNKTISEPTESTSSSPINNIETDTIISSSTSESIDENVTNEIIASSSSLATSSDVTTEQTDTQTGTSGGTGSQSVSNQGSGEENIENDDTTATTSDTATSTESETNGGDSQTATSTDQESETENQDTMSDTDKLVVDGVNGLVDEVVNDMVNLTRQLVTDENYYQFSRQSCVAVGDGTYHCSVKKDLPADPDTAVYAEQDAEGDMEIFMRTSKGDVKKLSDNNFDDTSPDFDLASMRVVWQRMIDGRYQIISYDLEKREEKQLTFSRSNSMEPKVSKNGIVWQAWDGNDWEIMYFDGKFSEQITDNDIQDVTPAIEDEYIIWNVLGGPESEAKVFSLESGETMTITGSDGGTVANPRFVLVYDTKYDNGDVITQKFDPVTGLAQPISAKPTEMPFDIPDPDPVGEIRALIQNKSTEKEKVVITVPTSDTDGDLNLASTSVSASATSTINLASIDQTADISTTTEEIGFELDEFDLIITDNASSTVSAMNDNFRVVDAPTNTASSTQL